MAHDPFRKEYPTRLRDGMEVFDHDDWDCLKDMEAAGLLKVHGVVVELTDLGWGVAGQLRRWRGLGNRLAAFQGQAA